MNKEHKTLLRKNRMALVDDLESEQVLNYLYQEEIFSENDCEVVRAFRTRQARAEKFLDTLQRRGPRAFDVFNKALLISSQSHLTFLLKCDISTEETQQPGTGSSSSSSPFPTNSSTFNTPQFPTTTPTENENQTEGDAYPMNQDLHGLCLIVNNATFEAESELSNRKGSKFDANGLQSLFLKLRYIVRVAENLRARNLKETVMTFAKENHSAHDSVVVCLLSHGLEGRIYGVDGVLVTVNDLVSMFNGNNVKTLIGKPKLFFIQACRGGKFDRGINVERVAGVESAPLEEKPVEELLEEQELYPTEDVDSGFMTKQSLPAEADILIAYSTVPGYVSWRNSDKGSWFVQALVEVFNKHSSQEDVASMLVKINRKVALEFESSDRKKQMPAPVIMLTRKVYFFPKS